MAKTFQDFMFECETWEYSQEYFDILKESMEYELMYRYMKNQNYFQENMDFITNRLQMDTSSYFTEAADAETDNLLDAAKAKATSIGRKIWNVILRAFKVVKTFVERLISKIGEDRKTEKELTKAVNALKIDDAATVTELKRIVDEAENNHSNTYKPNVDKQPCVKIIKWKINGDEELKRVRAWVACALTDNYVRVQDDGGDNAADGGNALTTYRALPLTRIAELARILTAKEPNPAAALKHCQEEMKAIGRKGLFIDVNPTTLEKDQSALSDAVNEISKYVSTLQNSERAAHTADPTKGSPDIEATDPSENTAGRQLAQTVQKCASRTVDIYTGFVNSRKYIRGELSKLVKATPTPTPGPGPGPGPGPSGDPDELKAAKNLLKINVSRASGTTLDTLMSKIEALATNGYDYEDTIKSQLNQKHKELYGKKNTGILGRPNYKGWKPPFTTSTP